MWIAIVAVVSLLLAFTAAGPKKEVEDARVRGLGDNAFPTSKYGDAVPWIFGTCEQKSPIVMWHGHFQPLANTEEVRTGIFSTDTRIVSYRYLLGFSLGVCLGPGIELEQIKAEGGRVVWNGVGAEIGGADSHGAASIVNQKNMGGAVSWWSGNFDQIVDPYVSGGPGSGSYDGVSWQSGAGVINLPAYKGIAYATFIQFYIGDDNAVPPRFSFVVKNLSKNLSASYSVMSNGLDLNPMEIVYTVLTQQWGGLGLSTDLIDTASFLAAAQTLHTEGFGMSMIVSQEQDAKNVIEECMRVADGLLYQDPTTGKFKVKLIRNDYTVGTLPVLDESNIIGDLQKFGRTTWENTYNQVRVNYQSRGNGYQSQVVVAQDNGNIKYNNGKIRSTTVNFPGVKDDNTARVLGARELELLSSPLLKCSINCNRIAKDWRPGDLFILNWGPYGMTNAVMRIVKIDFGTLTDNAILIDCVQDKYAKDLVSFQYPETSAHENIDVNAAFTDEFFIYNAPLFLMGGTDDLTDELIEEFEYKRKYMILAQAPNEQSLSFDAFGNFSATGGVPSGSKYKRLLTNSPYSAVGFVESLWDSSANGVDDGLAESAGLILYGMDRRSIESLVDNSDLDAARDGSSLMLIGSELMCYIGFTDLGDGRVQFDTLYRGMLNTQITNNFTFFEADTPVYFIRRGANVIENFIFPITYSNLNLNVKIGTRTPIGILDIDQVGVPVESRVTLVSEAANPLPPKYFRINSSRTPAPTGASTVSLSWKPRARKDPQLYAYDEDYDSAYAEPSTVYRISRFAWVGGSYVTNTNFAETSSTSYTANIADVDSATTITFQVQTKVPSKAYAGQFTFSTLESLNIDKT